MPNIIKSGIYEINDEMSSKLSVYFESEELRNYIIKNIIEPSFITDLKNVMKWRYLWRRIANILYIFSKILTIIGAVLAFSETFFQLFYLSFASGVVTLLSVLILQFGDFAQKERKRRTHEANEMIRTLKVKPTIKIENKNEKEDIEIDPISGSDRELDDNIDLHTV